MPKSVAVAGSSANTSCPYMTYDPSGRSVLSWLQQGSAHSAAEIVYAVFTGSTKTFGEPHAIATSRGAKQHGEDMPKILFLDKNNMLAVFAVKNPQPGNPYTGAVYYTWSSNAGKSWTPAQPLIKDRAKSYDQRYFSIARLPDGKAGIIWLNNSTQHGSTLYFATLNKTKSLSNVRIIAKHTCQCCRTALLVDSSGNINVAWRDIYHDSIRDMMYSYSADTGKTFSDPVRISPDNWVVNGCPHTGPAMAENNTGLHFSWFTMGGGGGIYYCSTDNKGKTFTHRQPVSALPSARHPQIIALPDNDLTIAWDEGVKYKGHYHERIGLQMRGPGGLLLGTRYLTPDSVNAGFPVLKVVSGRQILVAYTLQSGGKQQVKYLTTDLDL